MGSLDDKKFWAWFRSGLRRLSQRHPSIYSALSDAKRPYKGPNKRQKVCYECAECKGLFSGKDVAVDHIEPCGALSCKGDIANFVDKLFVGKEGLQVLCKTCHDRKTLSERLGITLEEASIEKQVIAFKKLPAAEQKKVLTELVGNDTIGASADKRVEQYRKHLKGE